MYGYAQQQKKMSIMKRDTESHSPSAHIRQREDVHEFLWCGVGYCRADGTECASH